MAERDRLNIRNAIGSDLDAIAEVWHESARSMDSAVPGMPSRQALRRRIDAELERCWDLRVALLGQRVVGLLAMNRNHSVLDQIFITPTEQGKGIGGALVEVAKRAMPNGFSLRMDASNERARRFYEKHGLKLLGEGIHPRTGIPVHFYGWKVR